MFWLTAQLFQCIKEEGGLALLDEYYNQAMTKLKSDPAWKAEVFNKFNAAAKKVFDALDEEADKDEDEGTELKAPRQVTCPNLGRWKSISATGKLQLSVVQLSRHLLYVHRRHTVNKLPVLSLYHRERTRFVDGCATKWIF